MRRHTVSDRLSGRLRRDGEEGVALITVIGTMGVVTALALTALSLVLSATPRARTAQDASTALAAAQAGVDEYISRLNANDGYWGNGGVDATNPALTTPAGFPAAAGRSLPGTSGTGATYKYAVLNSAADIASSGLIQLEVAGTSTAPSGARTSRTIIATLKIKGFLNYIYYSEVEATDPDLWANTATATYNGQAEVTVGTTVYTFRASAARVRTDCSAKYWEGRRTKSYPATAAVPATVINKSTGAVAGSIPGWNGTTSGTATIGGYCTRDIQFTTGDVISGPLHSNDLLKLGGSPLFADSDTTVYAGPGAPASSALSWGAEPPASAPPASRDIPWWPP